MRSRAGGRHPGGVLALRLDGPGYTLDVTRKCDTLGALIRSFADKKTSALWSGSAVAAFRAFRAQAECKLAILESAGSLDDLRGLPGNRLELLKGARKGQHSIRIND